MRYDPEHKARTRERVISEAAAALREHGPSGIGVADLMAKAGLTHGGFYAHFKSKDELIVEAVAHMFADRYQLFSNCMDGVTPGEGLARYVQSYLSARHRDTPQRGCPLPTLAGELARLPLAARRRFEAGFARLRDGVATALESMGWVDPKSLAATVVSEMMGALALARAVAEPALSDQILKAARDDLQQRLGLRPSA